MSRSVVDLLVEQPDEALTRMLDSARAELARLTVEVQQIEEALAKKSRRGAAGGRLTREQVYDLVVGAGRPLKPAEVHDLVLQAGISASPNAVRNHLARLFDEGKLGRLDDGSYAQATFHPVLPPSPADDDIPF